jgi:PiT family inorganic phosphate transporter
MESQLILVVIVIAVALIFDFLNGFHDAANSIATVVSTKVLSPRAAVFLAAVCNFCAAFFLETKVAATIGHDIVHSQFLDPYMVMFGLLGAIIWDLITWYYGLPTSSSHALVGGFSGAAVAKAGWMALKLEGFLKIVPYIVIAPIVGLVLGRLMMMLMFYIFSNSTPRKVDKIFRRGQLVSASIFSFSHGMNDAQKTMGIILALLISSGLYPACSHLGHSFLPCSDCPRDLLRRMENSKNPGDAFDQAATSGRILCGNRRRRHDSISLASGNTAQHYAHYYRCDYRRRINTT